jgi:uncharacterized damage-inducible protein DinB
MSTETGTETKLLLDSLRIQRRHVLGILEGLDEGALRRPVLPSGWTCLGLVRHLAMDVEEFWFRAVTAADAAAIEELAATGDNAWKVGEQQSAEEVFARYRRECEQADAIVAATALDAVPAWWPTEFGNRPVDSLRETLLHVITETACHTGHLDAARELIDGRRWNVMTAD